MAAAPTTSPNNNHNNNSNALSTTLLDSEIPSDALDSTAANTESGIDSALQAALREPRERVALLRLEAAVVDFCKRPNDAWMEVGGPFNSVLAGPGPNALRSTAAQQEGRQTSFQRCIVHRLADRFGIVRETGSLLEGSIRLIKRADTKIPARLLQDLEPHEYGETITAAAATGMGPSQRSLSQTSLNNSATGGTGSAKQPPRKMKIMKRSSNPTNNTRSQTGSGSDKQKRTLRQSSSSSFSEKERAYAEARARIFNDESETQASNSGGDENPPLNERSRSSSCERPGTATESLLKDLSSSSLENKAVYRNRMEEAADPDFRRCRPVMVSPSALSSAYAQNAGVMMQQQQQPQIPPSYYPPPPPPPFAGLAPTQALQNQQQQQQLYLRQQQQQQLHQQQQQHSSNFYSKFDHLSSTLPPMAVNAPAFYPSFARVTAAAARQQPLAYGTGVPGGPPPHSAPAATTTHAAYVAPAAALMKSSPSE